MCRAPLFISPPRFLTLDHFPYPHIDSNVIPCGYTHVDFELDDNGTKFDAVFVAGSIGSYISTGTVQPTPGWWYFIKGSGSGDEHGDIGTLSRDPTPRTEPNTRRSNAISSVKSVFASVIWPWPYPHLMALMSVS